jgi:hypothetical protein
VTDKSETTTRTMQMSVTGGDVVLTFPTTMTPDDVEDVAGSLQICLRSWRRLYARKAVPGPLICDGWNL